MNAVGPICRELSPLLAISFFLTLFSLAWVSTLHAALPAPPPATPLWPSTPPKGVENAAPEIVMKNGEFENVCIPTMSVYLTPKETNTGMALIICPGGGYHALDWTTHVVDAALYFLPRGITVIGLKYRTNPPNAITMDDRSIPLLDVKRAVQIARNQAVAWGIDPHKIGVVGYSAGADLAMTLASQFDEGDASSSDPITRLSNRPDFVVGCATWHWREKNSPYTFPKDTPPVFLVHATNDGLPNQDGRIGGAPIDLPYAIRRQLEALGIPVRIDVYNEGAHGVGNLIPQRVEHNFPPAKWPEHLQAWLESIDPRFKPPAKPTF